jgi:hypothetical protein
MIVRLKNAVFWDVMPRGSLRTELFGAMYRLHRQVERNERKVINVSSTQQLKHIAYRLHQESENNQRTRNKVSSMQQLERATKNQPVLSC